jgi:hypothetical protein
VALPLLTGDATMTASDFVKADPVLVSKELCRHPELISTKPAEFAVLLNALTASLRRSQKGYANSFNLACRAFAEPAREIAWPRWAAGTRKCHR